MYLGAMHELPCQTDVVHAAGTQQGLHEDLVGVEARLEARCGGVQEQLKGTVPYLVTGLRLQTGVDVLLHVQQILQQTPPHRLTDRRISEQTVDFLFS